MPRHTDRSGKSSIANKRRPAARRRAASTSTARSSSLSRRALVTASALVGALAIAGLAAWLLTEPATADSAASRAQATNDSATPSASPATATQTAPTPAASTNAATAAVAPTPTPTPAPAMAPATAQSQPDSQPQSTQPQPIAQGQQASIDPATGQLRPVEHDDAAALRASAAALGARRLARTAAAEPEEVAVEGGAIAANVPEELQTFTVASKTADGRVVIEHAAGSARATALVRARAAKKLQHGQGKEERHER